MKEDTIWGGEVNKDLIRHKIKEGIKLQKKQFEHMLKCNSCMDKFIEITSCLMKTSPKKKGK